MAPYGEGDGVNGPAGHIDRQRSAHSLLAVTGGSEDKTDKYISFPSQPACDVSLMC